MFVRRHTPLLGIIVAALFLATVLPTANAQGSVEGPNSPATLASTAGPFFKPWTSPGNAAASDDVDTTATVTAPLQQTDFLDATNFGFSIAAGRVIRRIDVKIEGRANTTFTTVRAQLLKGGVPVGSPMSAVYPNSATDGTATLSDQDDVPFEIPLTVWDATWTPAQINAADFGVRLDFEALSGSPVTFEVDHVRVWVYSFPTLPTTHAWGLIAMASALLGMGALALSRYRRRLSA